MTSKQESLYWRKWSSVCAEQGWKNSDTDMRHSIHAAALGKNKSHKDFNNADFDRVLAWFNKLIQPDSLDPQLSMDQYQAGEDPGERRRLIYRIGTLADPAYALSICRSMYQTGNFDDLTNDQLSNLRDTLNNRKHAAKKRQAMEALTSDDNPF